jgi:hypothetical protein
MTALQVARQPAAFIQSLNVNYWNFRPDIGYKRKKKSILGHKGHSLGRAGCKLQDYFFKMTRRKTASSRIAGTTKGTVFRSQPGAKSRFSSSLP